MTAKSQIIEKKLILTVTLNPAIDRLVESGSFLVGNDNRVTARQSFPGGKGVNVSRALKALGLASVATGFAGGANGQNLLRDLLLEGIEHNFVFIQGETRVNITVRDRKTATITRVIEDGPQIDAKDLSSFRDKFGRLAALSRWVVLSGRGIAGTPKSFCQELVATGKKLGSKVIVDTSGDDLANALKGKPFLVKVNRDEAQALLKKRLNSDQEQRAGLKSILGLGAEHVIVSLGSEGAVATDGKVFYAAVGLKVKAASFPRGAYGPVGCGDAMTGGFIDGFEKSGDFLEALAAGVAAGTASGMTEKPGALRRIDFQRIRGKVKVRVL